MIDPPVYESDPDARPDSDFERGTLAHLVPGTRGRLLDGRRTPVVVTDLEPDTGLFEVEIVAFEDQGARWQVELEHVGDYQFEPGGERLDAAATAQLAATARLFDVQTVVPSDPQDRAETERRIADLRSMARPFVEGSAPLDALAAFLGELDLMGMDDAFAERFVSNPASGELVKGHAIVLARLGLCPYHGKIQRSPDLFDEAWSEERRAEHIVSRLAFMRELFTEPDGVTLYRGMSSETPLAPRATPRSFVSATFDRRVAEAHYAGTAGTVAAALLRQRIPAGRLFMTFRETRAMNRQFRESEAVLLGDPDSALF